MTSIITICAFTFFLLAFRCFLLAAFEKKPIAFRLLDLLLGGAFLLCAATLKSVAPFAYNYYSLGLTALVATVVLLPAMRRLTLPYRSRPVLAVLKTLFAAGLFVFSLVVSMMYGYIRIFEDQPVLKITMTGMKQMQDVVWKAPDFPPQHQELPAYEVLLQEPDGQILSQLFLYGDQVAIKAKVIRFRPSLALFGLRSLCRIEYVYNGYSTAQRHNFYPHRAVAIPSVLAPLELWQDRFWKSWEKLYYGQASNALIKSATLESTFFPLIDSNGQPFRGSYYLTINVGGLSGVRAAD